MTKRFFKISIGAIILAASSAALANGNNLQPTTSYAKEGFFIGVNLGKSTLGTPIVLYPSPLYESAIDAATHELSFEISLGYNFKITPNTLIGIEFGSKKLNDFRNRAFHGYESNWLYSYGYSYDRASEQITLDLLLTAHYYLYQGFNVFGKVGAASVLADSAKINCTFYNFYHSDITFSNPASSTSGIRPEFSLGIGYTFFGHLDTHVAFTHIGGTNSHDAKVYYDQIMPAKIYDANMLMLGISYTF